MSSSCDMNTWGQRELPGSCTKIVRTLPQEAACTSPDTEACNNIQIQPMNNSPAVTQEFAPRTRRFLTFPNTTEDMASTQKLKIMKTTNYRHPSRITVVTSRAFRKDLNSWESSWSSGQTRTYSFSVQFVHPLPMHTKQTTVSCHDLTRKKIL